MVRLMFQKDFLDCRVDDGLEKEEFEDKNISEEVFVVG